MSGFPLPASGAITWAELLHSDAMRDTRVPVTTALDREVRSVQLVSEVEEIRSARSGTLVVLQDSVARAPWAVEIAVRYAWERDVRCVFAQLDEAAAQSVTRLAERLSTSVGFHDGDMCEFALRLSSLVTRPDAMHARLVARCATRLAEQVTVAGAMNALNQELPGVRVGLYGARGLLLAGLRTDGDTDANVVRVPLSPLDFQRDRELVAVLSRNSTAWRETVTRVLKIARASVVACEATTRLSLVHQMQRERWALDRLLVSPWSREAADELGWKTRGCLVGALLLPLDHDLAGDDQLGLTLRASWVSRPGEHPPVPYGDGWAVWIADERDDSDCGEEDSPIDEGAANRLAGLLKRRLARMRLGVEFCVGLGGPAAGEANLSETLGQAMLAARTVRASGVRGEASFLSLGARVLLTAGDQSDLRAVARDTLAELIDSDEGEQLIYTLAAYLDCGGSTARAAQRLGVHRNTVSGRMERVRRSGLAVDDPDRRLGLHVACYLAMTAAGGRAHGTPAD